MNEPVRNPMEEIRSRVEALGLEPIKIKLMDQKEGQGWARDKADHVEITYKRFLFLSVTRSEPIVPTPDVDAFWHQHILDTRKYAADCDYAFGFFLHHFPYFGMRGAEDNARLNAAFDGTKRIYTEVFGEVYTTPTRDATNCNACGSESCGGSGCVNQTCSGVAQGTRDALMQIDVRPSYADLG